MGCALKRPTPPRHGWRRGSVAMNQHKRTGTSIGGPGRKQKISTKATHLFIGGPDKVDSPFPKWVALLQKTVVVLRAGHGRGGSAGGSALNSHKRETRDEGRAARVRVPGLDALGTQPMFPPRAQMDHYFVLRKQKPEWSKAVSALRSIYFAYVKNNRLRALSVKAG